MRKNNITFFLAVSFTYLAPLAAWSQVSPTAREEAVGRLRLHCSANVRMGLPPKNLLFDIVLRRGQWQTTRSGIDAIGRKFSETISLRLDAGGSVRIRTNGFTNTGYDRAPWHVVLDGKLDGTSLFADLRGQQINRFGKQDRTCSGSLSLTGPRSDGIKTAQPAETKRKTEATPEHKRHAEAFQPTTKPEMNPRSPNVSTPPESRNEPKPRPPSSSGTGFFVSTEGHILTNNHVVEGCKELQLNLPDTGMANVRLIASDRTRDLAFATNVSGFA